MSTTLAKHRRVLDVDDCRRYGDGLIVTLTHGWAFSDPAVRTEDDPHGNFACHVRGFDLVKDALENLTRIYPCNCGRCARSL